MQPDERLNKIARFVRSHLQQMAEQHPNQQHDPVYRWEHTLRVSQYGRQLAEAENADVELVVAACLLHDVAHFESEGDYKGHGRLGARIARPLLETLEYPPEQIDNICYAIAVHVDGVAGFEHPDTTEAHCVSDADNLDRFGAYRILQWCLPQMDDFAALAEKLERRVQQLEDYRARPKVLETRSGDLLFKQQLDLQIRVFRALILEQQASRLPQLSPETQDHQDENKLIPGP
ncbi:MAG: HD domain-containing protein [Anaerolineales bacterium]|nr:HD domain-containing protein [Anaerolineales bacterium]